MPSHSFLITFPGATPIQADHFAFALAVYLRDLPGIRFDFWRDIPSMQVLGPSLIIALETMEAASTAAKTISALFLDRGTNIQIRRVGSARAVILDDPAFAFRDIAVAHFLREPFLPDIGARLRMTSPGPRPPAEEAVGPPRTTHAVMQIFYATDRNGVKGPGSTAYGKERSPSGALSLGTCEVSIPRDHRMGVLEKPSIWRFEFRQDPEKHIVLLTVVPQEDQHFWHELSSRIERSCREEAFVFVHGYDTSFEDAARRTAQIAYDLGFDGAPICYSWPSQGELADYPKDETNAQWTVPHLKTFLQTLAESSQAKTIHVIAHSMGNRAVSHALQLISADIKAKPCRMRQLVLAAPDIDADTFKDLAESIKKVADHVTLYISPLDKALMLSKRFHGYPRLGETVLVIPGIDTIDASAVDTSFIGHSYYGDNRSVLSDIFWLLKDGKPPTDRFGMHSLQQGPGVYYAFRP
jgi:esterase/lipase superfamily enzyme